MMDKESLKSKNVKFVYHYIAINLLCLIHYSISAAVKELENFFDIFESELRTRGTTYFGGSKPGFVDYMIWPWIERTEVVPIIAGTQNEKPDTRSLRKVYRMEKCNEEGPSCEE